MIRASVEQQLGGKATFEWAPPGMQCTFSIPPAIMPARAKPERVSNGAADGARPSHCAVGRRVLLVEDEALVAMMIQECLTESGHSVVGPICARRRRAAAAKEGDFDAAILDINLGDGMAYPVADIVAARGVPFVFVTGYEADTVDERFSDVPILQKPIERQMLQGMFLSPSNVVAVTRGEALRQPKARLSGGRSRAKRA